MLSELDPKKCAQYWPKEHESLRFAADGSGDEVHVTPLIVKGNASWFVLYCVINCMHLTAILRTERIFRVDTLHAGSSNHR